jgi:glycosyltransferase involved in cell wall biosynthesis
MAGPKVSICIPAYKQTGPLQKTLESVQMQGFLDYEIVLTDDSPDDAVEKLARSFSFGNKLRYFRNPTLCNPAGSESGSRFRFFRYLHI